MEDKSLDDFFNDDLTLAEEIIETEAEETPEAETETVEGTVEEPEAAKIEEPKQEPTMVPVSALQEERNKARQYRQELDQLRQQIGQPHLEAQSQVLPAGIPDPYDDPIAYHQYVQQQLAVQVQQQLFVQNLTTSRARAVQQYGEEYISDVADWAGEEASRNPNFEVELMRQADPAAWVIEQKKRSDLFKSFSADPDAYVRHRAAELGLAALSNEHAATTTTATNPKGPKSLAAAKSLNEAVTLKHKAEDDFDAIFKK